MPGCVGWGYYRVGRDVTKNHDLVWIGVLGKPFVFAIFLAHALRAEIPVWLAALSLADLLFGVLFLEFLLHAKRNPL